MGHKNTWDILNELITEFRRKGETIPPEVMADLRAAKTMINVLNADPTKKENVSSIEKYLRNVESHLIFAAQTKFGSEFMNRWMDRFREAWEKPDAGTPTGAASKFVFYRDP